MVQPKIKHGYHQERLTPGGKRQKRSARESGKQVRHNGQKRKQKPEPVL